MTGVRTVERKRIATAKLSANFSDFTAAVDLGIISPNIRTYKVRIPVATPTLIKCKCLIVRAVTRAEHDMLTILLPIRMVLNILDGLSISLQTFWACLLPSSAMECILSLFTVVRAVSDAEKNELSSKSTNMINSCINTITSG